MGAICDHLSVTFHPERNPLGAVRLFLLQLQGEPLDDKTFRLGSGTVRVQVARGVLYCSASGSALAHMREHAAFMDWLGILSEWPHRLTRLDAAYDVPVDGPVVLDALRERYASGVVKLSRKGMPVHLELGIRPDGRETGTFYVGHRSKARVTARVYDKAWERLCRAGLTEPPRTRYEVTVRQDYGATLRDAAEPDRLFWHVAAPALLDKPEGVPPWSADWSQGWQADPRPELLPVEILSRRVSSSAELDLLASIADEMGPNGRVWLARRLLEALGVEAKGSLSMGAIASPAASAGVS